MLTQDQANARYEAIGRADNMLMRGHEAKARGRNGVASAWFHRAADAYTALGMGRAADGAFRSAMAARADMLAPTAPTPTAPTPTAPAAPAADGPAAGPRMTLDELLDLVM